jgi:phosphatidate cytidylyltransferase
VTRVLSGLVLASAVFAVAWLAPPEGLLALAIAVATLAFVELAALCRGLGAPLLTVPAAIATAAVTATTAWPGVSVLPVLVATLLIAVAGALAYGQPDRGRLAAVAATVFAPIYLGLPLGGLVNVRWLDGREAAILLVVTIVASDTSQYYAGRLFGRRLLAPAISPKKTVAGAVGGFIGGSLAMTLLGAAWLPDVPPPVRFLLGLAVVAVGIAGDLFESVIKRAAQVKDSSGLIPGHGGMLDRIDALLLAAPVYLVVLRFGPRWVQ